MPEKIVFVKDGKCIGYVLIPKNASRPELFAAEEFARYIERASGAKPDLSSEIKPNVPFVSIGNTDVFSSLGITLDERDLNYDGFIIKTVGGNAYISAPNGRGVIYGVYEVLERFSGVKFLSPGETLVPKTKDVRIPECDIVQKPVFRFRNFYDGGIFFSNQNPDYADTEYNVHRRMYSDYSPIVPEWGYADEWYKKIRTDHNIFSYVPKEKYVAEHPEFFTSYLSPDTTFDDVCYLNGLNDDGSVDETKDVSVFKIALENLKKFILDGESKFFMLGINDAEDYCRCERCERAYKKYGARSAAVCLFANALSREIGKWKKSVGIDRETNIVLFAYSWCSDSPAKKGADGKFIVPPEIALEDNIYIRYCIFTGDNYNQAYGVGDPRQSRAAVENLKAWAAVAKKIMIWDYCANYDAYLWYFPCINYMADNVRFYRDINTQYLMSLSEYTVYRQWTTMVKSYVASKLYWNCDLDPYDLAYEFIDAYHGPFAPYMRKFFDLFDDRFARLVSRGDYFVGMNDWMGNMSAKDHPYEFLAEGMRIVKEGIAAAENSDLPDDEKTVHVRRMKLAMLTPQFMTLRNYEEFGLSDKETFFGEFVSNMDFCGLLTPAIKNEFRDGWSLLQLVDDPELVWYYTSRRYKLDCVDLIINRKMDYDKVSKRVHVDVPTLKEWVKEFSPIVAKGDA